MKSIIATLKFAAFLGMTLSLYSLWFIAPWLRDENARRGLREFIFKKWAQGFVWIAGARLRIIGTAPKPPFLLVSNHLSYFDVATLRSTAKGVFVAKADIESWFAAGTMIRNMGMIYINRDNRRDIPRAGAEIIAALERGEGVIIFAEGTTSNGKQVLPFKSSFLEFAAARDLPVYYASISYQTRKCDSPASEAVCWWREESDFATHLFDLFKLQSFDCTITFGSKPLRSKDRKILASVLQKAVAEQFEPVN
ncbi:MAG: lysophospholipid acyltransferase family protein [Pyrinomonadaceae bacterium]